MLPPLAAIALGLCAAVLLVSGFAKLREPVAARDAFYSLRLPRWLSGGVWPVVLPWAEIVLGVALLVLPSAAVRVAAAATVVLFATYWAVIARALTFEEKVTCGCFGKIGNHTVTARTLVRNTVLVGTAALALVGSLRGADVLWLLGSQTWGWLAAALLPAVVVLLAFGGSAPSPSTPAVPQLVVEAVPDPHPVLPDTEDEYVRLPIPDVLLIAPDAEPVTLRELAAFRPVLLIAVNCTCGSTVRTLDRIPGWAQLLPEVDVRLVSTFRQPVLAGMDGALYDHESIGWRALSLGASPSAVLLGIDGQLAGGPVGGEDALDQLVQDIVTELTPYRTPEGDLQPR